MIDPSVNTSKYLATYTPGTIYGILGEDTTFKQVDSNLQWFALNNGDKTYNIVEDSACDPVHSPINAVFQGQPVTVVYIKSGQIDS